MIELPSSTYSSNNKNNKTYSDQIDGLEDFESYQDDFDDDAGEYVVSTNAVRSQYIRPRDYRTRRLFAAVKYGCLLGMLMLMMVVVVGALLWSNANANANADNSSSNDGDNHYNLDDKNQLKAASDVTRKPIPDNTLPPKSEITRIPIPDSISGAPIEVAVPTTPTTPTTTPENNESVEHPDELHSKATYEDEKLSQQTVEPAKATAPPITTVPLSIDEISPTNNATTATPTPTPTATAQIVPNGDKWYEDDPGKIWYEDEPPEDEEEEQIDEEEQEIQQEMEAMMGNGNTMNSGSEGAEEEHGTTTAGESAATTTTMPKNTDTTTETENQQDTVDEEPTFWFEGDNEDDHASLHQEEEEENDNGSSLLVPSDTEMQDPVMDMTGDVHSKRTLYRYQSRQEKPLSPTKNQELHDTWGSWTFVDRNTTTRPTDDYCGAYPNRDIPWEKFPRGAWQTDVDYLTDYLQQSKELVMRAMEVHLAEYGFGPDDLPEDSFLDRAYQSPFRLDILDKPPYDDDERRLTAGVNQYAGWITTKSFNGLVRRLLHAIVSRDSFNVVLGGHSAAAGHGNHFQQSYALQIQRVLEPVFARLGIKHYSRNTGMGGLGTIQNAMGAQDIYGRDVDILIWDSGMTEKDHSPDFDLFARQGLLGSDRAPVLWSGEDSTKLYPDLQEHADVDYMMYGLGMGPIPSISDPTTVSDIPWAARYLKCDNEWKGLCAENRYNGTCWIERPDHFQPPTKQRDEPGGRASWHDGNRVHQVYGRTMSFTILRALFEAIDMWDNQPDKRLADKMWHVTAYYKNIQTKVANLSPSVGNCHEIRDRLPVEFCKIPFQARTEFTPRALPEHTSLRSIMKPAGKEKRIPQPKLNIYDAPDVYNPVLGVPEGEIDYLAIIENGPDFESFLAPATPLPLAIEKASTSNSRLIKLTVDSDGAAIVPGLGWGVTTKSSPNMCNGTYDSFCGRSDDQECLLYAHNDFRGGVTFDSLSGWGIFTLKNLKEGMIYVKMDSWHKAEENPVTKGWTEVNNGEYRERKLDEHQESSFAQNNGDRQEEINGQFLLRRELKDDPNAIFCDDFKLEFAFGDTILALNKDEVLGERHSLVQRVVQIWTVLHKPDYTNGDTVDIELGIRLTGCARQHVFWVTHIYWAKMSKLHVSSYRSKLVSAFQMMIMSY